MKRVFKKTLLLILWPASLLSFFYTSHALGEPDNGEYLFKVAACSYCHLGTNLKNSPLGGGIKFKDSHGAVIASNISSDKNAGIGSWSIREISRAITDNIGKNGRLLSKELHPYFTWMSRPDSASISRFIKQSDPDPSQHEQRIISSFSAKKWGIFSEHEPLEGYVPALSKSSGIYRGMYLVRSIGTCAACHSPNSNDPREDSFLAGASVDAVPALSPVVVDSGRTIPTIRGGDLEIPWTLDRFNHYLEGGKSVRSKLNSASNAPAECPRPFYNTLTVEDRKAIVSFLNSLD